MALHLTPDQDKDMVASIQDYADIVILENFAQAYVKASQVVRRRNELWWRNPETDKAIDRNVGELLMLCVSELAEAMEGYRKDLMDDKLPQFKMFDVEIADTIIRLLDLSTGLDKEHDIAAAIVEKCKYNAWRADHTAAGRLAPGGKKF